MNIDRLTLRTINLILEDIAHREKINMDVIVMFNLDAEGVLHVKHSTLDQYPRVKELLRLGLNVREIQCDL